MDGAADATTETGTRVLVDVSQNMTTNSNFSKACGAERRDWRTHSGRNADCEWLLEGLLTEKRVRVRSVPAVSKNELATDSEEAEILHMDWKTDDVTEIIHLATVKDTVIEKVPLQRCTESTR